MRSSHPAFTQYFDGVIEGAAQGGGRHVVLVLAHADGLRVDFDELGERVRKAASNGTAPRTVTS